MTRISQYSRVLISSMSTTPSYTPHCQSNPHRRSGVSPDFATAVHWPWHQLTGGPPADGETLPTPGPREAMLQLPWARTQQELWGYHKLCYSQSSVSGFHQQVWYTISCVSLTHEWQTKLPGNLFNRVAGDCSPLKSLICTVHPTLYSYVRSRATHCTTWSRHRWRNRRGQLRMLSCHCRLPWTSSPPKNQVHSPRNQETKKQVDSFPLCLCRLAPWIHV